MTDYQTEYPAIYRRAVRLVREARTRAPSFILLNHVASNLLDQIEDPDTRESVRLAAREYLAKERDN